MKTKKPRTLINNIINKNIIRVFVFFIALSLIFQPVAFAARRSAGGADLAEFSVGKWAAGTAIGLASFSIGNAVVGGVDSLFLGKTFMEGVNAVNPLSLSTWAGNFSVMVAVKQVGRAVGSIGSYAGWDPRATLFASAVLQAVAGAGLNPGTWGVTNTLNQMGLGVISGSVQGAILVACADKKGNVEPWAGAVAGLAGSFAAGMVNASFSSETGSDGTTLTLGQKYGNVFIATARSLPSYALQAGVGYLTRKSKPQDAYMIQQAFSGVYPLLNLGMARITNPSGEEYKGTAVILDKDWYGNVVGVKANPKYYTDYAKFQQQFGVGQGPAGLPNPGNMGSGYQPQTHNPSQAGPTLTNPIKN